MRIFFATAMTMALAAPMGAHAEQLDANWQQMRDYFNVVSDRACEGDGQALHRLMNAVYQENDPVAKNDLAWLYASEECVFSTGDLEVITDLQRQSADAGYPLAQSNYAVRLIKGDGVPRNIDLAKKYFLAAIEAEYGNAAVELGLFVVEGEYLVKDLAIAKSLYQSAITLGADKQELKKLRDKLDAEGKSNILTSNTWRYEDGEASWRLLSEGQYYSSVFVGRDGETGGFYLGFYREDDDPMIHFMSSTVIFANGSETELDTNGCYGTSCLSAYDDNGVKSAQVRIPIPRRSAESTLEALKSGAKIKFRYQTAASYELDEFKTMTMSLDGSRKAIEKVERSKWTNSN